MPFALVLSASLSFLAGDDPRREPPSSFERGLPRDVAQFSPYHSDPEHLLNRIFRTVWLVSCAPAEVSLTLPREREADENVFVAGWVHRKRAGRVEDTRWFGGDGRQLPVEGFDEPTAASLRGWLDSIGPNERRVLLEPRELAVLFQHDLLRLAQRLLDTESNLELLPHIARAARAVALEPAEREGLRNLLATSLQGETFAKEFAERLPQALGGRSTVLREVLRKSTRLFDAENTLTWSRVYLAHPDGVEALAGLLASIQAEPKAQPEVPLGFRAVLVQGIVAMGADGIPYATPVVNDVRFQVLKNREPLDARNPSFTRDGVDFEILQLEREGVRRASTQSWFRRVDADDQDLFRDYGTLKYTSYRAQCTLCHRNTDTPEPHLGGFPILRPHARAEFAATGVERLRLAEEQSAKLFRRLNGGS